MTASIRWLDECGRGDADSAGGKNASLGDRLRNFGSQGIRVPLGFATTANACWRFIDTNRLGTLVVLHRR
jgi:pyruvate,water dikinase